MTDITWSRVARALLGRWPSQVAAWGEEGIAAFVEELQADGLTAEQVLVALRSYRPESGKDFPPSVPAVVALASSDPGRPTFDELMAQLYNRGGLFGFYSRKPMAISPWVTAFVKLHGEEYLRSLPIDDPDQGKWRRHDLEEAWQRFLEASAGRQAHEIASRSVRRTLGRIDPLAAIGAGKSTELMEGE